MQLCNLENPNSRQNTCLVSVFQAHDTRANLWSAMEHYREQLQEMEGMELGYSPPNQIQIAVKYTLYNCRGRKISLFLSGDYEFLCKVYGLSGASG